jgi:hypothetical protein
MRLSFDASDETAECHYLETCCIPENIITQEESHKIIEDVINEDTMQQCMQMCQVPDERNPTKQPLKISSTHEPLNGCGFRNTKGIGFEVERNKDVAQFGEFPWHLALLEKVGNGIKYICGASLIHANVALTAAHCVYNKDPRTFIIRAGEWDPLTTNEPYPHSDYNVHRTIVFPDFNNQSMANDVALIILNDRVKLSVHVNMVCLSPLGSKFDNQNCFATGWGRDNFHNNNAYRANLKKLQLPIVPSKECQDRLRKTKLGDKFKLHHSFMCAGGEKDVDTCVGKFQIYSLIAVLSDAVHK